MEEQLFKTVTSLRKQGNLQEAWEVGCKAVQESPNDGYLKGAFFWVCYDYLKIVQNSIKERGLQNNESYTPNQGELDRINFLLDWIIWLKIPTGGFEYRSLLLLFQKNLEDIPKLVILSFNVANSLFEDEDRIPFKTDQGESPSLALKFARSAAKAWMENEQVRQIDIEQLLSLLNHTRSIVSDTQNLLWLDYDQAKCLLMSGRNQEARKFVIKVLKRKQSESWAWGAIAATYRKDDPDAAIKLFSLGISCARDEKFALKLLKGLAPLLAERGSTSEASMCVLRAVKCYEENGWNVKQDLERLMSKPWFDASVDTSNLKNFIEQEKVGAQDYLHGPTKEVNGLVTNLHKSGKGCHAYISETESISIPFFLFKGQRPEVGDYAKITYAADEDKTVVKAKLTDRVNISGVDTLQAELRLSQGGFGFVNDTFIPAFLINDGMDGKMVEVLHFKSFDNKKNKMGWKAAKVTLVDDENS